VATKALNATPQAGVTVRLVRNDTSTLLGTIVTGIDGAFAFDQVQVGINYRLMAVVNGRTRASRLFSLSTKGEDSLENLSLLGSGTVSGLTTDTQNRPLAGIRVTLTHPDPVYGGTFVTTSQADGSYSFADISAGNFSVLGVSSNSILQGRNSGLVRFDDDKVVVNLSLVDSFIGMPRELYDANGMQYDVRGDGSLINGTGGVFAGNGNADVRGSRLEILVSGVPVPFQNGDGSIGRLTENGQLLEVSELNPASGLNVSRRIYVPKNAYFARYLEVLENRTANPITVGVRVTSNIAPGQLGAHVVDSSSGDAALSLGAALDRDRWVVVDDNVDADPFLSGNNPTVSLVFDGEGAPDQVGEAQASAIGNTAKVRWDWVNVTIQPGASAAYMHFVVQQTNRASARQASLRLSQLPPEALEGLTIEERSQVRNFTLPVDGQSTVAPLPSVTNKQKVSGTVYAGDGATVMPSAQVRMQSTHPLFARTYFTSVGFHPKLTQGFHLILTRVLGAQYN